MPKETPVMRARTRKEGVGDFIRDAYESVSEQPLARIADMLGLSDIAGIKKSFSTPDDGVRRGEMVGGPSNLAKMGSRGFMNNLGNPKYGTMTNMVEEIKAGPAYQSMKDRGNRYIDPRLTSESPQTIAKAHPALPAEFNMNEDKLMKSLADSENRYVNKSAAVDDKLMRGLADSENRFQANRRAPIDMNEMPPGKMEYLDPDVAEYMNPKPMRDFTDPATQRRLRFLTGK